MKTIRASMLPGACNCMRMAVVNQYPKYFADLGYDIQIKNRTGAFALIGTGTHASARYILTKKIKTGVLGDWKKSIDFGISEFEEDKKEAEVIDYDKIIKDDNTIKKHIIRFAEVYYKDVAPTINFPENANPDNHLEVYIEKKFMGYKINGHIDVLTDNINDTKTGSKLKAYHSQFGGYGLLVGKNNFNKMIMNYLPRTTLSKPYKGTTNIEYDKNFSIIEAYNTIVRIINHMNKFEETQKESVFPANPGNYLCSIKYCKAWGTNFCKYFKRTEE